jgi:hypothetical protein
VEIQIISETEIPSDKQRQGYVAGFFYAQGMLWYEFIPEGCAINKEMYVGIHHHFRDAVKEKDLEKWAQSSWFLLHNNALVIGDQRVPSQAQCGGFGASALFPRIVSA